MCCFVLFSVSFLGKAGYDSSTCMIVARDWFLLQCVGIG